MELMGEIPPSVRFGGKYTSEFFNRRGKNLSFSTSFLDIHGVVRTRRTPADQQVKVLAYRRCAPGEVSLSTWRGHRFVFLFGTNAQSAS